MDELVILNKNSKCHFCGIKKNNHLAYGPIYKLGNIKAHYYCVLLSNRLIQNGNDEEGILGFLLSDILNELQRTSNILCFYCKRGNATIQCASQKCRRSFHLPCGLQNGSLHQFTHQFKSFCHLHRPTQNIPSKIVKEACKTNVLCCICYDIIDVRNRKDNLWAPCCLKTWYHKYCVQKLAHSLGYFFRCAICNNVQKFSKWMQRFGIFVPQQDASWEMVPHAFEELLFRYSKCDAQKCKCPQGRNKNAEKTMWEIVLCDSCGSQGIHVACGNLKFVDPEWECPACQKVSKKMKTMKVSDSVKADEGSSGMLKLTEINQKKRRRDSDDLENFVLDKRKKCKMNREIEKDGENEVDVETVDEEPSAKSDALAEKLDSLEEFVDVEAEEVKPEQADLQEVLSSLKPGPLSYKLALIDSTVSQKVSAKMIRPTIELIELSSDSDGEEETDVEVIVDGKPTSEKGFDFINSVDIKKNQEECSDEGIRLVENVEEIMEMKSLSKITWSVSCSPDLQTVQEPPNQSTLPGKVFDDEKPYHCTNPQNYFSSAVELFAQYSGKKVSNLVRQLSKTGFKEEDKEIVNAGEDEEIILSD